MRCTSSSIAVTLAVAALVLCVSAVHAQSTSDEATTDGGGTPEVLESIFIPSLPNAPFSLQLNTEWKRLTNNGGTFTVVNTRPIKRDSAGRIYQERWLMTPKGSGVPSQMSWIQIADPLTKTLLQCSARRHVCELDTWRLPAAARYQPLPSRTLPLANGKGFRTHEDLGAGDVLGLPVHLYRDTTTFNPGALGNDRQMTSTREFSYSAALGLNLLSVLDTPSVGRQQFSTVEITTAEPEAKWFQAPEGYRVVDNRNAPAQP